ncbi:hypothetical protein Ancab_006719 [Ancistrocladus abbreviatus]
MEMSTNGSRGKSASKTSVAAGSVWEGRMMMDEIKRDIRVFNGEGITATTNSEEVDRTEPPLLQPSPRVKKATTQSVAIVGKRKTPRSENSERNPIQVVAERSELTKNCDDNGRELSLLSVERLKRGPIQGKKTRSDSGGGGRSPIQVKKTRSQLQNGLSENVVSGERNSVQLGKSKSVGNKVSEESGKDSDGFSKKKSAQLRKVESDLNRANDELDNNLYGSGERNSSQLSKMKSDIDGSRDRAEKNSGQSSKFKPEFSRVIRDSGHELDGSGVEIEKDFIEVDNMSMVSCRVTKLSSGGSIDNPTERDASRSDEFEECEEKLIISSFGNVGQVNFTENMDVDVDGLDAVADQLVDDDKEGEEEEEEVDEEIEVEKNVFDVKGINLVEEKCKKEVNDVKKLTQIYVKPNPISTIVGKQLPSLKNHTVNIQKNFSRPSPNTITVSEEYCQRIPKTHSNLQTLVDLVMWRDVSKSAFVFGIGTFMIISSSYTKDLDISLISVMGYLGLVYLAIIFLYRSILCRGVVDVEDSRQNYVLGEEEAIWLVRLVLPYLNELLLKVKDLFSGDPAMTMKMAVALLVLARCGSFITIWKMVKLGFFGVFTLPKICSSYSTHITAYGKFWIHRFRDAWESCSHKKAVAFAMFTLFWNLSSVIARIWAAFMLFAAFRCYQQSNVRDEDCNEDERVAVNDLRQTQIERK